MVPDDPPAEQLSRRFRASWKLALGIGGACMVLGGLLWWGFEFGPFRLQAPHSGSGVATGGYLSVSSQEVDFFQLTISGSSASGTLTQAKLDSTQVSSHQYSCTGTVSGSNVTLSFPQGFGLVTNLSGEVRGSHLLLSIPQTDGILASEDFAPSNSGAYNSAVADLQTRAAAALQLQQQQAQDAAAQAAAAAQAEAAAKARQAVDTYSTAVNADISAMQKVSFSTDLVSATRDLQSQQNDLATMRKDEQTARQEPDPTTKCGDATTVEGDATTIGGDSITVQGDSTSLGGDVQSANSNEVALNSDFAKLLAAEAIVPDYQPASLPTQGQTSSAKSAFDKAVQGAQSTMAGDVNQAKTVASQADAEAKAFYSQMGCG